VRFLNKHYQIDDELSLGIMNTAMGIRSMVIKYLFTRDKDILVKIMTKIPGMIDNEYKNIHTILNAIR
jgi:hypothetical protein